jgi:hypothetical protein
MLRLLFDDSYQCERAPGMQTNHFVVRLTALSLLLALVLCSSLLQINAMSAFEALGVVPEIIKSVEECDWLLPTDVQVSPNHQTAIPLTGFPLTLHFCDRGLLCARVWCPCRTRPFR